MVTTLRATFDGKVLVPEGAVDLPVDTPLDLEVRPAVDGPHGSSKLADLADRLIARGGGLDLPADYSAQHDHYLYGTPKRADP